MVKSILDTDLYKFSTSYAYMKLYPEAEGTFTFCDRNNTVFSEDFLTSLKLEFANLSNLELTLNNVISLDIIISINPIIIIISPPLYTLSHILLVSFVLHILSF